MPRNPRRGAIPSPLAWLLDELDDLGQRIRNLEAPTGSQMNNNSGVLSRQLAYLASLKTHNDTGANTDLTNVPSDGTWRYYTTGSAQPAATELTVDCPTGKMIVSGAIGEASITPPMGFCIVQVGIYVTDANGATVAAGTVGCFGRRYTNIREGLSIRTNDALVTIADPVANPGPYRVRMLIGLWGASGNVGTITCTIAQPSVTVQIVGDGVVM